PNDGDEARGRSQGLEEERRGPRLGDGEQGGGMDRAEVVAVLRPGRQRDEEAGLRRAGFQPDEAVERQLRHVHLVYSRHATPSSAHNSGAARLATIASAAAKSCRGVWACGTTTHRAPAAFAARRPMALSSSTTTADGVTPNWAAASS